MINEAQAWLDQSELVCPNCGEPFGFHHDAVIVYSRGEDDETTSETLVDEYGKVTSLDVPSAQSRNPSARRDGVAIRFWCELCPFKGELTFAQHKGATIVEWR
jgi:hypothetical protein